MKIWIPDLHNGIRQFNLAAESEELDLDKEINLLQPVEVQLTADLANDFLILRGNIFTVAEYTCSRCLKHFEMNVKEPLEISASWNKDKCGPPESSIFFIESDQQEMDIGETVRDNLLLGQPMMPVCRADCRGLCPGCGGNLNKKSCGCRNEETDPRLDILKSLL